MVDDVELYMILACDKVYISKKKLKQTNYYKA